MTAYDVFVYVLVGAIAITVAPLVLIALLGALAAIATGFLILLDYLIDTIKRTYNYLFVPVPKPPAWYKNNRVN